MCSMGITGMQKVNSAKETTNLVDVAVRSLCKLSHLQFHFKKKVNYILNELYHWNDQIKHDERTDF